MIVVVPHADHVVIETVETGRGDEDGYRRVFFRKALT